MSFVSVVPEVLGSSAAQLADLGATLDQARTAAAASTTAIAAAADDEVSAAIAALSSTFGDGYQTLSAQATLFHEQFVKAVTAAGGACTTAEAANASPLGAIEQAVLGVINAPTEALLGRPLIGDGANGTAANPNGGAGGRVIGDGGQGGNGGAGGAHGDTSTGTLSSIGGAGGAGGDGGRAAWYGNGGNGGTGGEGVYDFWVSRDGGGPGGAGCAAVLIGYGGAPGANAASYVGSGITFYSTGSGRADGLLTSIGSGATNSVNSLTKFISWLFFD